MAHLEKVTVEKAYFDALIRRANFHTSTQLLGRPDPANVTISQVEYDSLLRASREYELLKTALYQGGVSAETLDLLISGSKDDDQRKDSGIASRDPWLQDFNDAPSIDASTAYANVSMAYPNISDTYRNIPWRTGVSGSAINLTSTNGSYRNYSLQPPLPRQAVPGLQRQISYGASSFPDDVAFDDAASMNGADNLATEFGGTVNFDERRTIYLSGFNDRTTYCDLLSIMKGGKLLSINMVSDRSATVTFFEGAAEFYTWAKRNDIYLNAKRVDIKWADRQYRLNQHVINKIGNGASRNIVIHSAVEKGLTEAQIRDDMEHIQNLVIIDVTFREGSAYVSTNSVHNALFARTCMMSRASYRGCKIEFYRDECDVPLPARTYAPKAAASAPKAKPGLTNRFDLLNVDGMDGDSDAENRTPSDNDSDDKSSDDYGRVGVRLTSQESGSS